MSAALPDLAREFASSFSFEFRSTTVGLVTLIVLVVLLVERELLALRQGLQPQLQPRVFDVAIAPLGFAFLIVVVARVLQLL